MKKRIIVIVVLVLGMGIYGYTNHFSIIDAYKSHQAIKQDEDYLYHYDKLSKTQKEIYKCMFYALKDYQSSVYIESTNIKEVEKIYMFILYDHPEIFYTGDRFEYTLYDKGLDFIPQFHYTQEQISHYQQQIDYVFQTVKQKTQNLSSLETIQYVYEYIIDYMDYQENKNDQNILSAFLEQKTVCAGYAKSFQYILNRLGYSVSYIVGNAKQANENITHAWNMIYYNHAYYYVDTTWGDVVLGKKHTCYGYYMMNSRDMLALYTPTYFYEDSQENSLSFFQTQECYMEKYDIQVIRNAIELALNQSYVAEIKCANQAVYKQLKQNIQSSYDIYQILKDYQLINHQLSYSYDDALLMIEIYL